jgi:amidase
LTSSVLTDFNAAVRQHDNALMLEVIAGDDGYDPGSAEGAAVFRAARRGVKATKIGGARRIEQATAEATVSEEVRYAAKQLADLGAQVTEAAITMHLVGPALWTSIGAEGLTQTLMRTTATV